MLCDHKQQGFEQAGKIKDAKTRELLFADFEISIGPVSQILSIRA
jgi:hypothetical protein